MATLAMLFNGMLIKMRGEKTPAIMAFTFMPGATTTTCMCSTS